jgi:hypothetical protein
MRKKQIQHSEVTESLLKFREKRKWQIALRRYVLEKNKSFPYAPFFGLDINNFRQWIEIQFDTDLNWNNFSSNWQFDHIIPVAYFDFNNDDDLRLCWNFINIRVEKNDLNKKRGNRVDVLAAKRYFQNIYEVTQYNVCKLMIDKISEIELSQIQSSQLLEQFIISNKELIDTLSGFGSYEYERINSGLPITEVIAEKKLLKKFGII